MQLLKYVAMLSPSGLFRSPPFCHFWLLTYQNGEGHKVKVEDSELNKLQSDVELKSWPNVFDISKNFGFHRLYFFLKIFFHFFVILKNSHKHFIRFTAKTLRLFCFR